MIRSKEGGFFMRLIDLPQEYKPTISEDFMNPLMREYFRKKLLDWRQELEIEGQAIMRSMQEECEMKFADEVEVATQELSMAFDIKTKDRTYKLIAKIDKALQMIDEGSYGYCLGTGEPISVKRLEARPIAFYSIEYQEKYEKEKKLYNY
jgi:DnaK suppressor protein